MVSNEDHEVSNDEPTVIEEDATRRDVLRGGLGLASGMALTNPGVQNLNNVRGGDEHVPDEPKDGGQVRTFEVHAIEVDLVYNRYGLHQPHAAVYVLKEDLTKAKNASGKVPCENKLVKQDARLCDDVPKDKRATDGETRVLQPLTLRVNRGDIIEIEFHNHLDRTASMHQTSIPYDVEESDGMDVGFNPDTTVDPGESITYRWFADELGSHFFLDGANQAMDSADKPPEKANLTSRGLFGSVAVYPQGTTWTDPYTGKEEQGRVQADIHVPDDITEKDKQAGFVPGVSYRDLKFYYHTPEGIYTKDGGKPEFPWSDEEQSVHAINYRADPLGSRIDEERGDAFSAPTFYSSWVHGDPGGGDNVYPVYVGDPTKVTAIGASVEENHVHHLHGHRWKTVPPKDSSNTIDSQTVGIGAVYEVPLVTAAGNPEGAIDNFETVRPNMEFDAAFKVGAGGAHESTGDHLFHCHLFPHYGEGMWGIMRILDKEHEGLKKLPVNDPPISADSDIEGYPDFIPGEFGELAPYPPYGAAGLDDFRNPTPEEERALTRKGEILPGAPYTDPCEPDIDNEIHPGPDKEFDGEVRRYTIVALPADIVYNDAGHHDPEGIVYALEEDAEKIRNGEMNPEPLVIRANVGDCVEVTLKNEVERDIVSASVAGPDPDKDGGKSNHIHFVSYDVLGSDSLSTGFNYTQQSLPERPIPSRWFADEEGLIFFHDHITGIENIMNGSFCTLIVEPRNSEWLDPHTGDPIRSGTQAIIQNPDGKDFREFALAYHDFAPLVDCDGDFVNPNREHAVNSGVMAINYRNTPYYIRDNEDPAYVHSSSVHGDPSTPTLEAYENDPVRIRLWQGAYEEQHGFALHGRSINRKGLQTEDAVTQRIGTSEAFTFDILPEDRPDGQKALNDERLDENPAGLPIKDYQYGSEVVDDLWDGMWGIHRVFGAKVDHLQPLPDRAAPDGKISNKELKQMGHPAPFSDFDWTKYGHKAKLLYHHDDCKEFPPDKDARQNKCISGNPPPRAPTSGNPCSASASTKKFDVSAIQVPITYNKYGDQDPHGIIFALNEHVDDILSGQRPPTPLTLWVNQNDCVEVNLTNLINPKELNDDHAHPEMRTKEKNLDVNWDRSDRISLHPSEGNYNVLGSDGATVGFNWDQTIPPGETMTYRWFLDGNEPNINRGGISLWDAADIRSNRHHGAYGQMVAIREDEQIVDPRTGEASVQGLTTSAIVKSPSKPDRRHFALTIADGQFIVNPSKDECVVPPGFEEEGGDHDEEPCNQIPDDPEDQGYYGINYRAEPFIRRFERNSDQSKVYDSDTHGDPATPIPRALLGDPVIFNVAKVADKARGLSFHLSTHQWNRTFGVEESENVGVDDTFIVGKTDSVDPFGGAGGLAESTGDHIYQELKMFRRLEGGLWGIFRVRDTPDEFDELVQPLPDRADEFNLRPEDRPGWNVAYGDLNDDGTTDVLIGVPESRLGGRDAGAAYLFYGPVEPRYINDLLDADAKFIGDGHGDRIGWNVEIENNLAVIDAEDFGTRYIFNCRHRPTGTLDPDKSGTVIEPEH